MNLFAYSSSRRPLIFGFVLVPAALSAATLGQNNQPPRSPDPPVLIWDIDLKLANVLPRNFRTTNDPLKENKGETPSTTGLSDLRASGSGEFTPESLKLVLARTRGPVTVLDLRQETHIFVNDLPVSWYASHGWANSVTPERVTVERASTEQNIVEGAGAHYVRITVTDHTRPLDDEADRFILAVRALPDGAWAHFHCEAGLGRTTTFMVLYDMLRNANRVSLADIVRRQKILGYDYDVLQPAEPGNWKAPYMADRAAFIRAFY